MVKKDYFWDNVLLGFMILFWVAVCIQVAIDNTPKKQKVFYGEATIHAGK